MHYNLDNTTHEQRMAITVFNVIQAKRDAMANYESLAELGYLSGIDAGLKAAQGVILNEAKLSFPKVIEDYRRMIDDSKNSTGQLSTG